MSRDEGPGYNLDPKPRGYNPDDPPSTKKQNDFMAEAIDRTLGRRQSREDAPESPAQPYLDEGVAEPTEGDTVKFSRNTSITGVGFGTAAGWVVVWLIEEFTKVDVPYAIEGAMLIVVAGLVALVYPESPRS